MSPNSPEHDFQVSRRGILNAGMGVMTGNTLQLPEVSFDEQEVLDRDALYERAKAVMAKVACGEECQRSVRNAAKRVWLETRAAARAAVACNERSRLMEMLHEKLHTFPSEENGEQDSDSDADLPEDVGESPETIPIQYPAQHVSHDLSS